MGATIEIVMAAVLSVWHGRLEEREYLCRIYLLEFTPRRAIGHPRLLEKFQQTALQAITQPAFCGLVQDRETIKERDIVFWKGVRVLWNQRGMDAPQYGMQMTEAEQGEEEIEGGGHCA